MNVGSRCSYSQANTGLSSWSLIEGERILWTRGSQDHDGKKHRYSWSELEGTPGLCTDTWGTAWDLTRPSKCECQQNDLPSPYSEMFSNDVQGWLSALPWTGLIPLFLRLRGGRKYVRTRRQKELKNDIFLSWHNCHKQDLLVTAVAYTGPVLNWSCNMWVWEKFIGPYTSLLNC